MHTVLVDMRARLAASERPDRIFEVVLETAKKAGLVGRRRVLDSTALYDAVATMDTVTLVRSAIRGLLGVCDAELEDELRGLLGRDDDYRAAGKPVCDYDDPAAREALIDALAKDARALLGALDGRELCAPVAQAAALLATVVGQDLDEGEDGVFRIARRVAKDRIISTVDPQARHGHKTAARGFDGYKGHVAVDPDSELITATTVTAGNVGDAAPARGPARRRPGRPDRRPGRRRRAARRGRVGDRRRAGRRARAARRLRRLRPTVPACCWTRWSAAARRSGARSSRPSRPPGALPRTPSRSTFKPPR